MRLTFPRFLIATTIALALATTYVAAQLGSFDSAFEGELWGVRSEVTLPGEEPYAGGIAFVGGMLFVADQMNETVGAFDSSGALVSIPGAEWEGFMPGELAGATVLVDGAVTEALLVSDAEQHRVLAFDLSGQHLFTMQLERPGADAAGVAYSGAPGGIYAMAMGPAAQFVLTTTGTPTPTLALENSFAAAWSNITERDGAVLAYRNLAPIAHNGTGFLLDPTEVLDGTAAGDPVAIQGQVVFGMVFDSPGNLYALDANTERLNVYSETFDHRFTFGTPAANLILEEFQTPYGLAYSPADGGRLFIGDSDNFRVEIYKPNLAGNTLDYVSTIAAFGAAGLPRAVAIDSVTGQLAVSNLYTGDAWILDRPALAAFDLQVLDASGRLAVEVCAGSSYDVRFSLTVPADRSPVSDILPELAIPGIPVVAISTPGAVSMTAGQVATYSYNFVMPDPAPRTPYVITAGASASTTNVLMRQALLEGVNCVGELPTIQASQNLPAQISGWTLFRTGETLELTFEASDAEGVAAIEYQITGQNNLGMILDPFPNPSPGTTQTLVLPLPEWGFSAITYRAIDTDNRKSLWQTFNLIYLPVRDKLAVEGDSIAFTVGQSIGEGYRFRASGLPDGITINEATGEISGVLGYLTAGTHHVTVTEDTGPETPSSFVEFQWKVTDRNAPPAITGPGNQDNFENEAVSVQIVASDVEGQALTYSASGLPPGLTIDSTGLITGLLGYTTAGNYPAATVTVSDGVTSSSVTFTWTVKNVNRPPVVTNPGTQNSAEGATLSLPISASVPDGQALTYSSTGLPPGLSINPSSGVISGTLTYAAAGTYSVTVRASDGSLFDEETFTWTVSDTAPPNQPPVCSATASAGDLWPPNHKPRYLSLTGITDPDGDAITIRYTGILQDEPVDSVGQGSTPDFDGGIEADGARAWVRSERTGNSKVPGDGRVYLISYTATDAAGASCSGTTNLGVPHDQRGTPAVLSPGRWNSLNGQQVYAPPPDAVNDVASVKKGKTVAIAVLGNDSLTSQPVVVTIVGGPSKGTATTNGQTITYKAPSTTGSATVTYRVTGPFGTDTATVTITIK